MFEQAAEGEAKRVEGFGKKTEAEPTLSHFALSALVNLFIIQTNTFGNLNNFGQIQLTIWTNIFDDLQVRGGLAEEWINQNHDGLAQKAGCPQEKLNEVPF